MGRDLPHDRDGAFAYERDGHSVGADTVAGGPAGGMGGAETRHDS